jgi:hypothetical protein
MKDVLYRNPKVYYILFPIVAALWPLFVWGVYLPRAERDWQLEKEQYTKAQSTISEILALDPDRLDLADSKNADTEFDYAVIVEKVANLCGIQPTNYRLSSGRITTSAGQKNQSAKVILKDIDIVKFANFISTIQLRWANLQCNQLKLTKKKGLPDIWDVDLDFKYYY